MEEALIKRIMPNSLEAEQSVVGSMIMSKDAIVTASEMLLKEDFFINQQYGIIFETMVELFTEGQPVDLVTLQNRLKEKDVPQEIQSLDFVRTRHQCADLCQHQVLCQYRKGKCHKAKAHPCDRGHRERVLRRQGIARERARQDRARCI